MLRVLSALLPVTCWSLPIGNDQSCHDGGAGYSGHQELRLLVTEAPLPLTACRLQWLKLFRGVTMELMG